MAFSKYRDPPEKRLKRATEALVDRRHARSMAKSTREWLAADQLVRGAKRDSTRAANEIKAREAFKQVPDMLTKKLRRS
jgi:hypothetical protein